MNFKPIAYMIRHGSTTLNNENRYRGHLNVDLDDNGKDQAKELKNIFKNIDTDSIAHASDLNRALETGRIVTNGNKNLQSYFGLRPLDIGQFAGLKKNDKNEKELDEYIKNPNETIPDGESLNNFKKRTRTTIAQILNSVKDKPVLIFAHASNIHEVGDILYGDHNAVLVKPGGAIMISKDLKTNKLEAEPIHKPDSESTRKIFS